VDEALMFEPTETESLQTLESLAEAIERIAQRAIDDPASLHRAPQSTPVSRVDEARAARHLISTEDAAGR
jgi:glycine dehydrogenase subunit 2